MPQHAAALTLANRKHNMINIFDIHKTGAHTPEAVSAAFQFLDAHFDYDATSGHLYHKGVDPKFGDETRTPVDPDASGRIRPWLVDWSTYQRANVVRVAHYMAFPDHPRIAGERYTTRNGSHADLTIGNLVCSTDADWADVMAQRQYDEERREKRNRRGRPRVPTSIASRLLVLEQEMARQRNELLQLTTRLNESAT